MTCDLQAQDRGLNEGNRILGALKLLKCGFIILDIIYEGDRTGDR
jgi:hypothetical protein